MVVLVKAGSSGESSSQHTPSLEASAAATPPSSKNECQVWTVMEQRNYTAVMLVKATHWQGGEVEKGI